MISTEDYKVEQLMRTLTRHPLVLLDQQLKHLVEEDNDAIRKHARR